MSDESIPFPEVYDYRKRKPLYREVPMKDTTSRILLKYFKAMAHLYGIIPPAKVLTFFLLLL